MGYSLKQRIGAGGYGEVWAAEAPGGLPKAVKFIFGFHDEKRAQTELKALNRIRAVRHPFLLSLERIDIVEDQMVVITELADMCLKTRFEQCVDSGLNGVPRAELLGYLRDAAAALDFIKEEFGLQHLDIKPENLLLLSGHIKVADFGLVKDLTEISQSMMSGLTPAYAPPELFDGLPNQSSDQYSLAIVFQEMLTGIRPFSGATAAQLASQHIKERPNLKPLPREDQATISRALSKDPELRFPSCGALIEALSAEKARTSAPSPRTRTKLRDKKRKRRRSNSSTITFTEGTRPFAISETHVAKLSKLDYDLRTARFRPTLFLGLGKTGTHIVQQLRHRMDTRFGEAEKLPAVKLLCLDTDVADLRAACSPNCQGRLGYREIFEIPLRKAEEYRSDARMHLNWLSRRWIYNVPRSLRTEGIRPLGRLAMATHIEELAIRLRQTLSELVEAEHLAITAETLELEPEPQPRVVIVGSISGGTCSGIALDLAYITRSILRQLSVPNEEVIGVFTHSSSLRHQRRELSIANSLAFLNELYHFSCVEEYPGDDSCGILPSTDGTTTFASTYLSDLGDDLEDDTFQQELDSIAEYLYLSTATPSATFFDNCRTAETDSSGLPLRSMGVARSVRHAPSLIELASDRLQRQVLKNWSESTAEQVSAKEIAAEILSRFGLTSNDLVPVLHDMLERMLNDPVPTVQQLLMQQLSAETPERNEHRVRQSISGLFGFDQPTGAPRAKLTVALDTLRKHWAEEKGPKLAKCVLAIADQPGTRISGAWEVAKQINSQLADQIEQMNSLIASCSHEIKRLTELLSTDAVSEEDTHNFFTKLSETLLQRFSLEGVLKLSEAMTPAMAHATREIDQLLDQLATAIPNQALDDAQSWSPPDPTSPSTMAEQCVLNRLGHRMSKLGGRVEQQLQHNLLDRHGGMRAVLQDVELRYVLRDELANASRQTIVKQLKEISLEDALDEDCVAELAKWMSEAAVPSVTNCGGAIRWMHAYPLRGKPVKQLVGDLSSANDQEPTVIPATVGELISCVEVERVPLDNLAMRLYQHLPDSMEYASRLHTRNDINWTHISSMR